MTSRKKRVMPGRDAHLPTWRRSGAASLAAYADGQLSAEEGLDQFRAAVQRFLDIPAPV